jgi:hypothetical protein
MYQIVRREAFSENCFLWEVRAPDVAMAAEPGHFVMLRLAEGGERIPLTVADYDRQRGTVTVVVQALGKTTRAMRDDYAEGDQFDDFVGPLGLPQHIRRVGHVVLVGGGLGVAPVFPQRSRRPATVPPASSGFAAGISYSGPTSSRNTATRSSSAPTTAAPAGPASSPRRCRSCSNTKSRTWRSRSARCR